MRRSNDLNEKIKNRQAPTAAYAVTLGKTKREINITNTCTWTHINQDTDTNQFQGWTKCAPFWCIDGTAVSQQSVPGAKLQLCDFKAKGGQGKHLLLPVIQAVGETLTLFFDCKLPNIPIMPCWAPGLEACKAPFLVSASLNAVMVKRQFGYLLHNPRTSIPCQSQKTQKSWLWKLHLLQLHNLLCREYSRNSTSSSECSIITSLQLHNKSRAIIKYIYIHCADVSSAITPVFRITWSFRNYSNMLILWNLWYFFLWWIKS